MSSDSEVTCSVQQTKVTAQGKMAQIDTPIISRNISVSNQTTIMESHRLTCVENYGTWALCMKNVLLRDNLCDYCTNPPSDPMADQEYIGRRQAMSAINWRIKGGVAIKLLKRYKDPFGCWTSLKARYESDSHSRKILIIDKFFSIRRTNSMDEYLANMKEAADEMEELDVGLLEPVVVFYTTKNLPK